MVKNGNGIVISKAMFLEKIGSVYFQNVLKDAVVLLMISFVVIIISAALEVFVSAPMFYSFLR